MDELCTGHVNIPHISHASGPCMVVGAIVVSFLSSLLIKNFAPPRPPGSPQHRGQLIVYRYDQGDSPWCGVLIFRSTARRL